VNGGSDWAGRIASTKIECVRIRTYSSENGIRRIFTTIKLSCVLCYAKVSLLFPNVQLLIYSIV